MTRLIDTHPDFRPRAWLDELPPLNAFGTLVFQVLGQQLSVTATQAILARLVENFEGRLPSPAELLGADAQVLRRSGMSARKVATLRAIAERFVDGRLSEEVLAEMSDDQAEAALTEVPGVGPWTAHGFLLMALDRPDVLLLATWHCGAQSSGPTVSTTPHGVGDGPTGGALATVSKPRCDLPVHVRIRRASAIGLGAAPGIEQLVEFRGSS